MQLADIEKAFFPVAHKKVVIDDGPEKGTYRGFAVVREDTGEVLSRVSENYSLVPDREVVSPFIKRFGAENFSYIHTQSGSRLYKVNVGDEFDLGEGDMIRPQITIENSYNKSRSFRFLGGAFRKVCSNGMYGLALGVNFRQIHMGDIPYADQVKECLHSLKKMNFKLWKRWRSQKLTVADKTELVRGFKPYDVEKPAPADRPWYFCEGNDRKNREIEHCAMQLIQAPASLNNQMNGWGLLNNINSAIARSFTRQNLREKIKCNLELEGYLKKQLN